MFVDRLFSGVETEVMDTNKQAVRSMFEFQGMDGKTKYNEPESREYILESDSGKNWMNVNRNRSEFRLCGRFSEML